MTDSEPGDASGIGFLSTEVSHDPSGSPKDYTFVPELSSLALGGIHGVPMNATMLVAHYAGNRDFNPLWNKLLILQEWFARGNEGWLSHAFF